MRWGKRALDDLDDEIREHLERETQDNLARGLAPDAARQAARRKFGNVALVKEHARAVWVPAWLDQLRQDLEYGIRGLLRHPGFAAVAILTLALGIGANTAAFTIVNAVLLGGLPFNHPEQTMWLDTQDTASRPQGVSLQDFEDWRVASRSFSRMAVWFNPNLSLAGDGRLPASYSGAYMSASAFDIVGEHAALGRVFRDEDDRPGAVPVVLIGSGVWKSRYAGDPTIIGQAVIVNGGPATVIGVMPDGFGFPTHTEVWLPSTHIGPAIRERGRQLRMYGAFGHLADGVTLDQARAELAKISAQLAHQYPESNKDIAATVTPFLERAINPEIRTISWALMGAVGLVLLIACANVANLLLARAAKRSREIAVRTAVGATRWRIVRQLLVESLLMSFAGGAIGLGLAQVAIRWFATNAEYIDRPYWITFTMDLRVAAFFVGICVLTGVLFGLAPALHISRSGAGDTLKEGGRSGIGGRRARRWTGALIVAELTLTLALLSGAGFMMRSFLTLYGLDVGIDTSHLLTMQILLPTSKFHSLDDVTTFLRRVDDRLNTVGNIEAASTTTAFPLLGADSRRLTIAGRTEELDQQPPSVAMLSVGSRYFDTLGVRLVRGRPIVESDGPPGHEVAVINQRFAATYFPAEDPIGKRIRLFDDTQVGTWSPWTTIIGVAPSVRQRRLQDAPLPDPVVYIPHVQNLTHRYGSLIIVRARTDPGRLTAQLREEMFALDPELPLTNISTMDQRLARDRWPSRVFGTIFTVLAAMALLLASVGLYAVTAHSVAQRTAELGVRVALGARPVQIVWLVIRRAAVYVATGLAMGLACAVGVGTVLSTVLVQTTPTDVVTLISTAGILVFAATLACL